MRGTAASAPAGIDGAAACQLAASSGWRPAVSAPAIRPAAMASGSGRSATAPRAARPARDPSPLPARASSAAQARAGCSAEDIVGERRPDQAGIAAEQLVGALAVEHDADAGGGDAPHDAPLGVGAARDDRLVEAGEKGRHVVGQRGPVEAGGRADVRHLPRERRPRGNRRRGVALVAGRVLEPGGEQRQRRPPAPRRRPR